MRIERVDPVVLEPKRSVDRMIKQVNKLANSSVLVWQGDWDTNTHYEPGDVVTDGTTKWLSLTKNNGVMPIEGTDWTEFGGSAGGGSSELLAFVAIPGTSPTIVNPDPTSRTLVPGMSLSLVLTTTKTVRISFELDYVPSGGGSRFSIYKDGTIIWPEWGSGGNVEVGWLEDSGDGAGWWLGKGACIIQLNAGTHNIEVRESASGSTAGKTYYGRLLEVRDYS